MGFANLKNVTTGDAYTLATTLRLPNTERIVLQIANAAVLYQLDESSDGKGAWLDERFLAPSIGSLDRRCSGIRFRSAVPGAPAQVSCELIDADELAGGSDTLSAFAGRVLPSGIVGATLSLITGDVFWTTRTDARDGAVPCDGALYDAEADPTFEPLWLRIGTTFGGTGKSSFAVPDLRGRMPVMLGTHADVDAIGDSDGLAVGARRPKHKHSGTAGIGANSLGGTIPIRGGGFDTAVAHGLPTNVGPQTGNEPTDSPGYFTLNAFIVK